MKRVFEYGRVDALQSIDGTNKDFWEVCLAGYGVEHCWKRLKESKQKV